MDKINFITFSPGVEKVNFFLGPQIENETIFCQNPKVPPRIPCYHSPFKKVKNY